MTYDIIDNRTIDELRTEVLAGHTEGSIEEIELAVALGYDTPQKMTVLPDRPFTPAPPNHVHIAEVYGIGPDAHYYARRSELPAGWHLKSIEDHRYGRTLPLVAYRIARDPEEVVTGG